MTLDGASEPVRNGDDVIELLFAACLSATPESCKERSIWFIDTTHSQCQDGADRQLAKWRKVNPDWVVGNWTCTHVENRDASLTRN